MRYQITLTAVENNHPITPETDPAFLRTCQQAILLALREQGLLGETEYRAAECLRRKGGCL